MSRRHAVLALVVAVCWAVNFVVIDIGLESFPPLLFAALRFGLIAFPAIFFVPRPDVRWLAVVAVGLFICVGQFGLLFVAMNTGLPAGLASVIAPLQPVFTIPLAAVALGERPSLRQVAGVSLAVAGIGAIAAGRAHSVPLQAVALGIASAAAWGCGNVVTRAARPKRPFSLLVWSSVVAPVPLLGLSLIFEGTARWQSAASSIDASGIAALAYVVIVSTFFGYGTWYWLLSRHPASTVAPFTLLVPVVGILTAWLVRSEHPTWGELLGSLIVLVGLALALGVVTGRPHRLAVRVTAHEPARRADEPRRLDHHGRPLRINRRVSQLIAGWRTGLSRPVLILQGGNALNYLGYGLVLPFEIIYLHQIRGFSTSTAGLVLAATMGTSAIVTPPTGALLDRYSAKGLVVGGSLASALGYAGFAFVERPWQAFACSIVSGAGLGAAGTANRTLVVRLVTPKQRAAAFALNRVAGNFGIGLGASVAGFVVAAAQRLSSFQLLYLFDAVTYAGFALIVLAAVPSPRAVTVTATDDNATGFRAVARDRLFLTVIAANIVLVVVGHTLFSNILSPFLKAHTSVGPAEIGIIVLVNTSFIVIAQIPAVRVVARMRRTHAFALTSALFAVSLLAVLPATLIHSALAATSLLVGVAIVFALGEIAHILVLGPLVADMAPAHLLGRYLSLYSLTFTLSLAIGPAIGGLLLQSSPDAIWWGGALAAVLAGAVLLRLGDRIPDPLHEAPPRLASAPEAA